MADNTLLNAGTGGDTSRAKDRSGVKTSIVGIDINVGGAETLLAAGQAAMTASMPVVLASDQTPISTAVKEAFTPVTGTLTNAGDSIVVPVPLGTQQLTITTSASSLPNMAIDVFVSTDGGTNYALAVITSFGVIITLPQVVDVAIPGGATHIKLRCSGSSGVGVSLSAVATRGTNLTRISGPITGTVSTLSTSVEPANKITSGTLTANDAVVAAPIGDGTIVSGASTPGSVVYSVIPDGYTAWTLLLKSYTSGTIYTEASTNTTTGTDGDWVEVKGRRTGTAVGVESVQYAMVSNGFYRGNAAGFIAIRARLIGGGTQATVQWVISKSQGATFLNSGIPAGASQIGQTGNLLYNGTAWEIQRNNFSVATGDAGTKTATFQGAAQTNFNARGAVLDFVIGTVTGTTPTLVLKLQRSPDGGTTWIDITGAATASITAAGNYALTIFPGAVAVANSVVNQLLPRTWRVVGTITGTTPSFPITLANVSYTL